MTEETAAAATVTTMTPPEKEGEKSGDCRICGGPPEAVTAPFVRPCLCSDRVHSICLSEYLRRVGGDALCDRCGYPYVVVKCAEAKEAERPKAGGVFRPEMRVLLFFLFVLTVVIAILSVVAYKMHVSGGDGGNRTVDGFAIVTVSSAVVALSTVPLIFVGVVTLLVVVALIVWLARYACRKGLTFGEMPSYERSDRPPAPGIWFANDGDEDKDGVVLPDK